MTERRIAVVTGGGRGAGAATAAALAKSGWDVAITYSARPEAAKEVAAGCQEAGARALPLHLELSDPASIEAAFQQIDKELGTPTDLVNNAAIVAPQSDFADMDTERIRRTFAVNTVGPMLCAREAVRRMSTRRGGAGGNIVNVSSVAARHGSPGEYVDYAASKGALDTFTMGLAKEVAGAGIRVNSVRFGILDTEIHASGGWPTRAWDLAPSIPLGRPGTVDEAAAAVLFLLSPAASYVTGAILDVGGGR